MTGSLLLPPPGRGAPMCNTCDQIDNEIEQLRMLMSPGMDALSLTMIRCAVEMLEGDRTAVRCHGSPPKDLASARSASIQLPSGHEAEDGLIVGPQA